VSGKRQSAPADLEKVRLFVNSVDLEHAEERLTDPRALVEWLGGHELIEPRATAGEGDLRRAVEVREALRALILANNGGEDDAGARARLREAAARADLGVTFDADGSRVEPAASGVDGALGRLLAIVHESMRDGTWERLKACPWDTCRWAFYDHTKNRSGVWCEMETCGNRAKARAYRERHSHRRRERQ
jgi:predicted RNA-binding Zn ribbon-like protein